MGRVYQSRTVRSVLRAHEEQLRKQGSASILARSGLSVPGEGVTASPNFVAGSAGFAFYDSGNAEFNDLTLRGGIIGNAALTSPVAPLSAHTDGSNFSLATGANVPKLTITVPVPTGYTSALVLASGNMNARNTTAAADYGYLGIRINGVAIGWSLAAYAGPGLYCAVSNSASALLSSLSSSFTVQAACSASNAAWAADVNNTINLDAMVLFLR